MIAHIKRRIWFYMLLLVALGTAGAFIGGRADGVRDCEAKHTQEALNAASKRAAIANNRPDLDGVVKRLRSGSF
ncbi:MAG: hypothetical protein EOM21_20630 [Gammaproteobacteria bacterium]|nr:hypothetical protein [Gammaproteobacteria bacterium]